MRSLVTTGLVSTQRHYRIRSIFLARRESYGVREAARLTGRKYDDIRRAIRDGEIEAVATSPNDWRIPWVSLAAIAVDMWGIEAIELELGPKQTSFVLPPLVRMANITLRLPRYQVAMLEVLARRPDMNVNSIVADALLPIAEERIGEMELIIPGFAEAIHFPETEWKRTCARKGEESEHDPAQS
jgi:hypothetical protein